MVYLGIMVLVFISTLGLIFGSFVNALVWRLHLSLDKDGNPKKSKSKYSILNGRSVCPHCKHQLSSVDLIPVVSWAMLRGKCRYCKKPISIQYPMVELLTGFLYLMSAVYWPYEASLASWGVFSLWLLLLTGLVALAVYDARWKLLPNVLVYPLIVMSVIVTFLSISLLGLDFNVLDMISSVGITSGIFYLLYILSDGRWIGGGDVKYGLIPGILLADPLKAFFYLMFASVLGSIVVVIGIIAKRVTPKSQIPFGPFLIASTILLYIFGGRIVDWYQTYILLAGAL